MNEIVVNLKSNVHILWEKMVKDSYSINYYNPNLYLIVDPHVGVDFMYFCFARCPDFGKPRGA